MKVLLINPPDNLGSFLGKGEQFVPILEPLGLLSIAATVRNAGYNVEVLDAFAMKLSMQAVKESIAKDPPDVLGLTSFISSGDAVYEIGRWAKVNTPQTFVILGNTQACVYAEAYLRSGCCDCVVHGEGEEVFVKILQELERKGDWRSIKCLSYLKNDRYKAPSEFAVVQDLATLPLPARDLTNKAYYNFPSMTNMPYSHRVGHVAKHMMTSRGCPFHCSFCAAPKEQGRRCFNLAQVSEEMKVLIKSYDAEYIFLMDPIFAIGKKRVLEICRMMKRTNLKLRWGCEGHINSVDEELISAMEAAGCHDIAFGIESGVQRILDSVSKDIQLSDVEKNIRLIKKKTKIKVSGLFILGLPGETYEDSLQTIAFAKRLPLDMAQFSIFIPYPGSPLFYELSKKGEIDTGIRDDGSLDTSVWQRYSSYASFSSNDLVWVTKDLTEEKLKMLQRKAIRDFYLRPRQIFFQMQRFSLKELSAAFSAFQLVWGDPNGGKQ